MSLARLTNQTAVTVLRPTVTVDVIGGRVESFARVARLRARVQAIAGREEVIYGQERSLITHKVYMAGAPDVARGDRLRLDPGTTKQTTSARLLEILAVDGVDVRAGSSRPLVGRINGCRGQDGEATSVDGVEGDAIGVGLLC